LTDIAGIMTTLDHSFGEQPDPSRRTAVVTGATAGVGRATALAFARRGFNVGLIARGEAGLAAPARDVAAGGGRPLALAADVADADAVFRAADRMARECGAIDVWVNDAMATVFAPIRDVTPDEFRRATEVTYLGTVHGTMAALRHMRPRNAGTIVQVGSALSYRAIPLQAAYCGAKFAIRGFTDALRSELAHETSRVRVSMVQLPAVNTPQFDWARNRLGRAVRPLPPVYQPEAIAHHILRAADAAPRELWLGLSALKAILGNMLAPGLGDRLLAHEAYDGQMTPQPHAADEPDNLFAPVAKDHAMHGRFDATARGGVIAVNPAVLRTGLLAGLAFLAAGCLAAGR
jgi:NAD(P)-dependent dehydrogenase (short-subunit alcohol dehydrogenase family)